jgi:hypothetical protein
VTRILRLSTSAGSASAWWSKFIKFCEENIEESVTNFGFFAGSPLCGGPWWKLEPVPRANALILVGFGRGADHTAQVNCDLDLCFYTRPCTRLWDAGR